MIEILVAVYLIFGLLVALLIWTVLMASKELDGDNKTIKQKHFERNPFRESKTEPSRINF